MRIIAGKAKGMRLCAPKGMKVRPTLDRVRESLFNILGPRVSLSRFLDLYAGSGANGIEALSRGASCAVFVDKDLQYIRPNLQKTRLDSLAVCVQATLPGGLEKLGNLPPFDIIYADPPFKMVDFAPLLTRIAQHALLAAGGVIVLEHASRLTLEERFGPFQRDRVRTYGETQLSFYLDAPAPIC
jgi:16S rRNA (guanine(966)-N(2))-methyltransferase RsmD